jgi:MFS family permease
MSSLGTILIVALSGFLMGFDGSLFTGAVVFVKGRFELSSFEVGWAVVSHTIAATVSIFLSGPLADRLGARCCASRPPCSPHRHWWHPPRRVSAC